jgi:hypothetical protein
MTAHAADGTTPVWLVSECDPGRDWLYTLPQASR